MPIIPIPHDQLKASLDYFTANLEANLFRFRVLEPHLALSSVYVRPASMLRQRLRVFPSVSMRTHIDTPERRIEVHINW